MKIEIKLLLLFILIFQVFSCDNYKSKVPITNSDSSSINKDWIDKWVGLNEDELNIYPWIEVNLQAFNEREYVATVKTYGDKGRKINSVETYKVHNSKVENNEFLNIKSLNSKYKHYLICKIEEDLKDSIYIRLLTDTLKIEFETPNELRDYLIEKQSRVEDLILSKRMSFYKWNSLIWDRTNKQNKSENFDEFYILGKQDEKNFMSLSKEELEELLETKDKIQIDKVRDYFQEIQLINQGDKSWKVLNYGLIKMKSGNFIKLKFDLHGPIIKDLTNNIVYFNRNKEKWKF